MKRVTYILLFLFLTLGGLFSQTDSSRIIQLSGVITVEERGEVIPLPYATVGVMGTRRGAVTDIEGFFSLVVLAGETIQIRSLGFMSDTIQIPIDAPTFYSIVVNLEKEAIELPLIEILPIPSREFFKQEFLAMNIEAPLADKARENLSANLMAEIRNNLPPDGSESSRLLLKQQASQYYYVGQFKPQNILNPLAWKKFIESWKRGDFKKKKKDE